MTSRRIPDNDALIAALQILARTPDGDPLLLSDNEIHADPELLIGMLDAAIEELAQEAMRVGRGNSKRHLVVRGYRNYYLHHNSAANWSPMSFFQRRLERIASDMKTASKLPD